VRPRPTSLCFPVVSHIAGESMLIQETHKPTNTFSEMLPFPEGTVFISLYQIHYGIEGSKSLSRKSLG
jgi:hypothetical protein